MRKTNNLFLSLERKIFQAEGIKESFKKALFLPEREFPPKFLVEGDNFLCAGYFLSYEPGVNTHEVVDIFQKRSWLGLQTLPAEFLIIYLDLSTRELLILTDRTGKFPVFFSFGGNRVLISTDFKTVKDRLSVATLNTSASIELIARQMEFGDETVLKEIRKIPPFTLFAIDKTFSCKLTPISDIKSFCDLKSPGYKTPELFADRLIDLMKDTTGEYLNKIENLSFGSDISSGFDSTLVSYLVGEKSRKDFTCYCGVSKNTASDTNPKIVSEFARKHSLSVKFIEEDALFPLSTPKDLELSRLYPNQVVSDLMYNYHLVLHEDGVRVKFSGDGGDELYKSAELPVSLAFPAQETYFSTVKKLKLGIGNILTRQGIELLLDRDRFSRKQFFPNILPPSLTILNSGLFPIYWKLNIWPITPFSDVGLILFASSALRRFPKRVTKQQLFSHREDIFVPSQFQPKKGPVGQVERSLSEKPQLIIDILSGSILAKAGLVRAHEIVEDIKKGNIAKYKEGDSISFLLALVKLEYFLQKNNIEI